MIQKSVGQGGMGAVYQARDVKRQQIVAVKEMGLSMIPPDEQTQAIQNFKIEARMLASLHHANLPAFTGFFSENSRYYMVMEYIDGATLETLLERNRAAFSERRVLGWARQLCDVLEYLHNQQPPIIFRDMKPGNIMLTRDGHIKLIDFGIARFFRPTSSQDTQLLGTPGFAPPEQYGKAQTDERSDIYSLAITLFQLLSNTLSENGFGLRDIRKSHPNISHNVARALEKATELNPEDRYANIAEFRRALLGEGTFVFENNEMATSAVELAQLCQQYPEEAANYLSTGEIEAWLREIGELDLLRTLRHMRSLGDDPQDTMMMFVNAVLGSNPPPRNYNSSSVRSARGSRAGPASMLPFPSKSSKSSSTASRASKSGTAAPPAQQAPSRTGRSWLNRKQTSPVVVSPRKLDFGSMFPEVSTPMSITISGNQGFQVSGSIDCKESWILLEREQFDGSSTRVEVRVDATHLTRAGHYTGQITIVPDSEGAQSAITVRVEAEVVEYVLNADTRSASRGGSAFSADLTNLDELDFEEDLFMGRDITLLPPPPQRTTRAVASQTSSHHPALRHGQTGPQQAIRRGDATSQSGAHQAVRPSQSGAHQAIRRDVSSQSGAQVAVRPQNGNSRTGMRMPDRNTEYIGDDAWAGSQPGRRAWDPVQISPGHATWLRRIITGMSAFMLGSVSYNLVAHVIPTTDPRPPLPPNPLFIIVLTLMIPAATLGALLVNWKRQWSQQMTIDSTSTGMISALIAAALVRGIWLLTPLHSTLPLLLLFVLLLATAIAAAVGVNQDTSLTLLKGINWAIQKLHTGAIAGMILIGSVLGYVLAADFATGCLTPFGILLGTGVSVALIWRADQLAKQSRLEP